ncbi:hypothetical protein XM75_c20001 [Vibrio vulnificus]|nr:hypothetical protein XM75_c20001 [Vibrio vulnificus]
MHLFKRSVGLANEVIYSALNGASLTQSSNEVSFSVSNKTLESHLTIRGI